MKNKELKGLAWKEDSLFNKEVATLSVDASKATLKINENIVATCEIDNLKSTWGGNNKNSIFLHGFDQNYYFSTENHLILEWEELHVVRNALLIKSQERKKTKLRLKFVLLSLFILLLLGVYGLLKVKENVEQAISINLTIDYEKKIGKTYIDELIKNEKIDSQSVYLIELKEKTKLLINQVYPARQFNFYISKDTAINAFALPGGYIVLNEGLFSAAKNWEEILGVVAHEMAHITENHFRRKVLNELSYNTIITIFIGDMNGISNLLLSASKELNNLSYSREFEREADERALDLLVKAKINPMGLVSFFNTLNIAHKHNIPEWMSTHPDSENRAKNINNKIQKLGKQSYLTFEPLR